jgi:transcriptional regulator with XRE-family HTH domain
VDKEGYLVNLQRLGKRIQELREKKGLSQRALAEQSGVPFSTLARWEAKTDWTQRNLPRLGSLINLVWSLGTTLDSLLMLPRPDDRTTDQSP